MNSLRLMLALGAVPTRNPERPGLSLIAHSHMIPKAIDTFTGRSEGPPKRLTAAI